jgi:hypothetical protein
VQVPNGSHEVTFHPTVAGKYTIQVSLVKSDGTQIPVGGSPFPIEIMAGPVFASNCKVEGKSLETGRVGDEGTFKIFAFDKFSNPIRRGGDLFDIKIMGPISISTCAIDCGDGSYNASYMITKAGSYKITISVNTMQVARSPFSLTLVEGDTHPTKTTLVVATKDGTCGTATIFTIQAHDVYGNPRTSGGDKFSVSMVPPQLDKAVIKCEIKDNGNGTYQVTYTASIAGEHHGEVVLADLGHVTGSPFRVKQLPGKNSQSSYFITHVSAGAPHAAKCVVQGQAHTVTAGTTANFVVQLRDQFGNNCDNGDTASLDVKMVAKDAKNKSHISAAAKDNKNGTITVEYIPIVSGIYTVQANVVVKGIEL